MNTEYTMLLVSREFLLILSFKIIIKNISSILMQDIKKIKLSIKIAIFLLNFSATFHEKSVIVWICAEAHIVDNLKINLLIEIDNLTFNKIFINFARQIVTFEKCQNAEIVLFIIIKADHQISWSVYANTKIVISSHTQTWILIRTCENLSKYYDYIFDFKSDLLSFYIHTMNFFLSFTHMINKTNKSVIISKKTQVNILTEWDFINMYHINIEEAALIFKEKL